MGAGYFGKKSMAESRWVDDDDRLFYQRVKWEEKFAFWPTRCELSHQRIWLKRAFLGTAVWTGPGSPVYEYRWRNSQEHMMWLLTKEDI
jgi:hypothetical protein